MKKLFICLIPIMSIAVSTGILYYAVNTANDIRHGEYVTAKYYDTSKNEIKKIKIRGGFAKPPEKVDVGKENVFVSWNKDILNVNEDIDIYPVITDISDTVNAIYIHTAYVPSGKKFSVNLELGGNVECSSGKIFINYNPERLEFKKANTNQNFVIVKHDSASSRIEITFDLGYNINSHTLISALTFIPIVDEYSYTELKLELAEIKKLINGGESVNTDCSLYHGKIYSY